MTNHGRYLLNSELQASIANYKNRTPILHTPLFLDFSLCQGSAQASTDRVPDATKVHLCDVFDVIR